MCTQGLEIFEAFGTEEFGEAELSHELPIRTRKAEGDVRATAGDIAGDGEIEGAAGQDLVMGLQDELGHGR